MQRQVQQARNPQQKSELKNKLNDIHHEISNRTQKQLQAFAEENPSIKQPKSELDQSLRRCAGFFTVDTAPLLCHQEHIFDNYANTSDITIDGW